VKVETKIRPMWDARKYIDTMLAELNINPARKKEKMQRSVMRPLHGASLESGYRKRKK